MSDFDYGNARLRAMKSRLLTPRSLEGLTEAGSVPGLLAALADTAYREAVAAALARSAPGADGVDCLEEALRNDLLATLGQARHFFRDQPGELAALVLRRHDLHNVKAVLRGLARHVPPNEIIATTLPIGDLRPPDLAELAQSAGVQAAIDLLATWALPLSRPLLAARDRRRGDGVESAELALERWHVSTALEAARQAGEAGSMLLEALMLEADIGNLLTALRLAGLADVGAALREHFGASDVAALFVGPGRIAWDTLSAAARRPSIREAVNALAATPYGPALAGALEAYARAERLSAFERALARLQLRHAARLMARDPLGIGVLLGYAALKTNEVANLRAIAQGLRLGDKPERIRGELMAAE